MTSKGTRFRRIILAILLAAVSTVFWLVGIPLLATSAAPNGTITVCPAGPPTCDHETVQQGIDAAGVGDTVLVHAGTYTEQVTLKSRIALRSSDGPISTTITADQGPIVSASSVSSEVPPKSCTT